MTGDARAGGVASGWNHFGELGSLMVAGADGCRIRLEDGSERLDFVMGWGSLLLGHRPLSVHQALISALTTGAVGYQYESSEGLAVANILHAVSPVAEKVRFTSSGLEATMYACRVARAVTGRAKILKFEGHFHGLNDLLMYNSDSSDRPGQLMPDGTLDLVPATAGLLSDPESRLLVVPFNDIEAIQNTFTYYGHEIAAVILEPIALNIGCIAPDPFFLEALREITEKNGSLLIFDEILTGFRVAHGGAQELFGVVPDLACYGKAFGCGAPLAALAGRSEFMDAVQPPGDVAISGTNTGRRFAMIWALAALKVLGEPDFYSKLNGVSEHLEQGLRETFARHQIPVYVEGYGGRIGVVIGASERPRTMGQISDVWLRELQVTLFKDLSSRHNLYGFLLPLTLGPEPLTISAAHTFDDVDEALAALDDSLARHV